MSPDGRQPYRQRPDQRGPQQGRPPRRFSLPMWYLLLGVALALLIFWASRQGQYETIKYGDFRQLLVEKKLRNVRLTTDKVSGELNEMDAAGKYKKFMATRPQDDRDIYGLLSANLGPNWDQTHSWLESPLVFWLLPLLVLFLVWRLMVGRINPVSSVMDFSQSKAHMVAQKDVGITFDDVAGIEECKRELQEVVEFLSNPSKFTRLGGRIPKGVLLVGAPGTGKTLLAKAVAGEANVTFFSLSGSDFVEMFVGVGAARVRDLFDQAQKAAPCIVFIDELDALGKARGMGFTGGHDEREQTLNALLVQMDGFTSQKGIIMLAATNRPEMLDPALLRPGRFDRQVVVPNPDLQDRKAILKVHVKHVKLGANVDLDALASMTPGFVGADLANLVNEATLLAARRNKNEVEMADFHDSIERVVAGLEKRTRLMNADEKNTVAHHEAGHAVVACLLPGTDPVRKVSMIPRGLAALGYTMQMPTEDRYLMKKSELMDRMAIMLGGRSAEEVIFGEVSTGAQNDLEKATELAHEMVTEFGMWDELGPLSYRNRGVFRGFPDMPVEQAWSERTMRRIDDAVRSLVESAHAKSTQLLADHKDALVAVAAGLKEKEALEEDELREILGRYGIAVVHSKDRRAGLVSPEAKPEPVTADEAPSPGAAGTAGEPQA